MTTSIRSSALATNPSGTAISVAVPTGTAAGDAILVFINANNLVSIVDNNGANPLTFDPAVTNIQLPTNGMTTSLARKVVTSADLTAWGGNLQFTIGTPGRWTAVSVAVQNPNPTGFFDVSPIVVTDDTSANDTGDSSPLTTLTANSIHIAVICVDGPATTVTGTPVGYTTLQNGGDETVCVVGKTIVAAGAVANQTFTYAAFDGCTTISFAIAQAPPAAAVVLSGKTTFDVQPPLIPKLIKGFGVASQPLTSRAVYNSAPGYIESPKSPSWFAGAGKSAPPDAIRKQSAAVVYAPEPPRQPSVLKGFGVVVAAGVAAQISAVPPPSPAFVFPLLFSGNAADPGLVAAGIAGAFVPDNTDLPVQPQRFPGVALSTLPAVASVVRALDAASPYSPPPPSPVVKGFGSAAQPPVVLRDPWFSTASFDPVALPPQDSLFAGSGQAAQRAAVVQSSDARAPAISVVSSVVAGFGAPAQTASLVQPPDARAPALLPPQSAIVAGFGQSAQPAAVYQAPDAHPPVPPATPSLVAGFGVASQPPVVYRSFPLEPPALPPVGAVARGAGQYVAPASVIAAPSSAPRVELLVAPAISAGSGATPALPVPTIASPPYSAPRAELPPFPVVKAGFGQAAQVATLAQAPAFAPSVDLFVTGRLVAGFGSPPSLPPPFVGSPRLPPSSALLPPQASILAGFGLPAQPAIVYSAPRLPDPPLLPAVPALLLGVVPPPIVSAVVYSAPRSPESALLPPAPVVSRGVLPAPVAAVLSAPAYQPSVDLFITGRLIAGFGTPPSPPPPYVGVAVQSAPRAELPPAPLVKIGFGNPAQNAVVIGATLVPPSADLPPLARLLAGVLPPLKAVILRQPPTRDAFLPPAALLAAGFGRPAQNAFIIATPFSATVLALLPPSPLIFAGFGDAPPPTVVPILQPASREYTAFVGYDEYILWVRP